jgi:HD superfamily phosphohydrolase
MLNARLHANEDFEALGKAFLIRDPVHGYIQIAAHERILVDHPVTQRLRRINQTGLADLVYPEARTSRLAHSLGAMHLASRFLIAAIENAKERDVLTFFAGMEKLNLVTDFKSSDASLDDLLFADRLEGGGLKAATIVFRHKRLRQRAMKYKRLLGLAEAGLRLAALFHDLGHLPFSHDMEFAIEEYVARSKRGKRSIPKGFSALVGGHPHEVIGHELASLVFQSLIDSQPSAVKAAFALARQILHVPDGFYDQPTPNAGVIEWLHSLVDGEVDVDRADYLLRDARALGFEFAIYDLDRLISNLVLVRHNELGLATAIEERGFSALESFYVSRSRSNQYLPRHHKVAQIAMAFRYGAENILASERCRDFRKTLGRLGKGGEYSKDEAEKVLISFGEFDDTWWLQQMRAESKSSGTLFAACSRLILYRKPTLVSAWKRKGDLSSTQVLSLNSYISESLTDLSKLRDKLRPLGVLVLVHQFRPVRLRPIGENAGESLMLLKTGKDSLVPVTKHSALIRSLINAWNSDIHLHVFQVAGGPLTTDEIVQLILAGGKNCISEERSLKEGPDSKS